MRKTLLGRAKDNPLIAAAISVVTLISVVGGGALAVDSRYEHHEIAQAQFQQMQQQIDRGRYSQVLADISRLIEAQRRRPLTPEERNWMRSLEVERRQLACRLRIEPC